MTNNKFIEKIPFAKAIISSYTVNNICCISSITDPIHKYIKSEDDLQIKQIKTASVELYSVIKSNPTLNTTFSISSNNYGYDYDLPSAVAFTLLVYYMTLLVAEKIVNNEL